MTIAIALGAAVAAFLLATGNAEHGLGDRISSYLMTDGGARPAHGPRRRRWGPDAAHRAAAAGVGAVVGVFVGLTAPAATGFRPVAGMALAGAGAGFLAVKVAATQRRDMRARSLRQELPSVADALALHVLAGEAVPTAIELLCEEAGGAVVGDLATAMAEHRAGAGLAEALIAAARRAEHPDAARLYEALAHAHHTGGRLADRLAALATDFRAAIGRDLVAEGGRRALATYGPILALQIPVTLLFLIYPTLVGLGELSATP